MVSSNRGYPDPDNPSEDIAPNNEIILVTDTDTDDEDNPYNDYEPLPMNDITDPSDEENPHSDSDEASGPNTDSLPQITRIEATLVTEVWSAPLPRAVDIEMDSTRVDEVKKAMNNFTLPPSAIPEWANTIPEEQWKQQLINRLQQSSAKK